MMEGSGTSSIRTSPASCITVGRMFWLPLLSCSVPKKGRDRGKERPGLRGVLAGSPSLGNASLRFARVIDARSEIKEFLTSRRARITPEQAGLVAYGSRFFGRTQRPSAHHRHQALPSPRRRGPQPDLRPAGPRRRPWPDDLHLHRGARPTERVDPEASRELGRDARPDRSRADQQAADLTWISGTGVCPP
jgi:hypothetical protein